MMRVTRTYHVAAAPEDVFRYVVDRDVFNPRGTKVEAVHETPAIKGNVYTWTSRMFGLRSKGVTVYTDYVPDRRLTLRNFGGLESDTTWTVEPDAGGSRVTVDNSATVRIPLLGRFLRPMLTREMDSVVRTVKAELERQGSRVGTAA